MAEYEIQAPNGKTYTIEGPPGASQEEVRMEVLKQHPEILHAMGLGGGDGPKAAPSTRAEAVAQGQPRSILGQLGHWGKLAGRTVVEGLGNTAEFLQPASPIKLAHNIYQGFTGGPREDDASRYGEHATNLSNRAGLDAPEGGLENIASSSGKAAIAAALLGPRAALVDSGLFIAPAIEAAAAKALPAALRGGAVSGATSGAAGETVRQMGGGEKLQFAASLVGGLTPAALQAKGIAGATKSVFDKGHERAARLLQRSTSDTPLQVRGRLATAPRPSPGVNPLTAQVADDTGLAALHRERMNTAISDQHVANQIARGQTLDRAGGTGDVTDTLKLAERQAAAEEARIEADRATRQAVQDAAEQAAKENISPLVDREVSGGEGRGLIQKGEEGAEATTRADYRDPILDARHPVNLTKGLEANITNAQYEIFGENAGDVPPRVQRIIGGLFDWAKNGRGGIIKSNTKTITNTLNRLSGYVGRLRSSGAADEAGIAEAFVNRVRSLIEAHAAPQMPKGFAEAAAKARASRKLQGTLFEGPERNPVAGVLAKDRFDNPILGDVQVPGALVQKGADGGHAANTLIAAVGRDASEPFVRQEVRRLIEEGHLTPENVQHFGELLKRYPQVEARVNALQDIQRLGEVQALENQFKGTPLHGMMGEPLKASEYVSSLLANGKTGDFEGLVNRVKASGDPKAVAGLRRAIADHIQTSGASTEVGKLGKAIPSVQKSREAIDLVLTRARDILTPEQVRVFEGIRDELKGARFAETAGVPAREPGLDMNIPVVSRAGGVAGSRTIRFILKHFSNQDKVDDLIVGALRDPKAAAELLKRPVPHRLSTIKRSLRNSAIGTVAGTTQITPASQPEY